MCWGDLYPRGISFQNVLHPSSLLLIYMIYTQKHTPILHIRTFFFLFLPLHFLRKLIIEKHAYLMIDDDFGNQEVKFTYDGRHSWFEKFKYLSHLATMYWNCIESSQSGVSSKQKIKVIREWVETVRGSDKLEIWYINNPLDCR